MSFRIAPISGLLFSIYLSLSIIFTTHTVFAATDIPDSREEAFQYHLMVPLPTSEGTVSTTTGIVDYIKTLYLFAMGIAGVIAMGLIVFAGFQWLTSAGSYSTISKARNRMSNAIFGLVILLGSYLLLNTINPALVNLKEPYIYFIKWTEDFEEQDGTGGGGGGAIPDWCFEADGVTPKITTCLEYAGNLVDCGFGAPVCAAGQCQCVGLSVVNTSNAANACESDPCSVDNGPCDWYAAPPPGFHFNCHPE